MDLTIEEIIAFRQEHGLSQEALGVKTNCSQAQVSKIERGQAPVPHTMTRYIQQQRERERLNGTRPSIVAVELRDPGGLVRRFTPNRDKVVLTVEDRSVTEEITAWVNMPAEVDRKNKDLAEMVRSVAAAALEKGYILGITRSAEAMADRIDELRRSLVTTGSPAQ